MGGQAAGSKIMNVKKTILCVDDNEQSLSIRKLMLATRGYRVIVCTTGEEALEVFRRGGIDLVLTDLMMPGMNGDELANHVKQVSPETPVILFSGKVAIYDQNTQADIFCQKGYMRPWNYWSESRCCSSASAGQSALPA